MIVQKPYHNYIPGSKSGRSEVFCKKGVLKKFVKFTGKQTISRSSRSEVFLKNSPNSQKNTCARVPFLIKLQNLQLY